MKELRRNNIEMMRFELEHIEWMLDNSSISKLAKEEVMEEFENFFKKYKNLDDEAIKEVFGK